MVESRAMFKGVLAVMIVVVVTTLAACGGGGEGVSSPTQTVTPTRTVPIPTSTPVPTPTPIAGGEGTSFSLDDLKEAWEAKGLTPTVGGSSTDLAGLKAPAFDMRLMRGSDSMEVAVLIYKDREVVKEDWELTPGKPPMPKAGRNLPSYVSLWWNENVIVVVRSVEGEIGTDALDAFLALGP